MPLVGAGSAKAWRPPPCVGLLSPGCAWSVVALRRPLHHGVRSSCLPPTASLAWSHRCGGLRRAHAAGPAQGPLVPAVRVLAKEAHHLRRGIRPLRVGMRCARTPPRPGMAHRVHNPLLHVGATLRVMVDGAGVGIPTRHLPPARLGEMVLVVIWLGAAFDDAPAVAYPGSSSAAQPTSLRLEGRQASVWTEHGMAHGVQYAA